MKLLRYQAGDQIRPAMLDAYGAIRDLSSVVLDINGDVISPKGLMEIASINSADLPKVAGKPVLAAPVANPSKLIFGIRKIVSFDSEYMTLLPGDVIMTGTPPGVGAGMRPPRFLNAGDVVELGIKGLGEQRQEILAWGRSTRVT